MQTGGGRSSIGRARPQGIHVHVHVQVCVCLRAHVSVHARGCWSQSDGQPVIAQQAVACFAASAASVLRMRLTVDVVDDYVTVDDVHVVKCLSIDLDCSINLSHECVGSKKADGASQQPEGEGHENRVAEVE